MGDRVNVEFIGTGETTSTRPPSVSPEGESTKASPRGGLGGVACYNLNGQRVGASYKGVILQNGRKVIKR